MRCFPLILAGIVLALVANTAVATVRFVNVNSATPAAPYLSWATAATSVQDAVTSAAGGDMILVTNGLYAVGGTVNNGSNRVYINKTVTVQSVNGPAVTTIRGAQVPVTTNGAGSVRCV